MPSNVVPVTIGSDALTTGGFVSHDDLGRGFKLNIAPGESPFKDKVFKTKNSIVKRTQVKSYAFCEVMDSLDKVNDHLNIAGHLSVSYGPMISGEGAGKYLKSSVQSSKKSSLRYCAQHIHSYSRLLLDDDTGREPTPAIEELMKNGGGGGGGAFDPDTYGTMFVDQVIWGAQLDVTFTVEDEEEEDLSEIMAELKGQIGVGVLKVGFSAKFEKKDEHANRRYKMMIQAKSSGVPVEVPGNPSLEKVFEVINDFNKKYKELCVREDGLVDSDETCRHTYLSPIAFVLAHTEDYLPRLNGMESAFLEQQMGKVGQVFKTASFWIARLTAVHKECEAKYKRPSERETVARLHTQRVVEEVQRLTEKQAECLQYRQLPLKELIGRGCTPAVVPDLYPSSDGSINRLQGLLGNGCIGSPVDFGGSIGKLPFSYEGFTVLHEDKVLRPCLSGKLLDDSTKGEVARARTPEMLAGLVHIKNHKFNPDLLKTRIMNVDNFDPQCGDLFIPEDMREMLDQKNDNGDLVGPVFKAKKMVLMGPMGAGKTALFNRLTGSTKRSSACLQTCTTSVSSASARGPASDLKVDDTPGTANSERNGMEIDEALQLRKSLTTGNVTQIVAVISFPNNERKQAVSDQLAVAIHNIFDCETFKRDSNGTDVTMREANHSSPRRTRAFLVVTHRDCAQVGREKFLPLVHEVRRDFPWIGPVAFIDERVSLGWLYDTVVACAGYQQECCTNHTIPLVEMFSKFKMTFKPLNDDWEDFIEEARHDLSVGANCAIETINTTKKAREADGIWVGGNYVDRMGPAMDCVMRFIDDLFEKTVQETMAKCYGEKIEDLWICTDEHINNERVNTMNVIKQQLAPTLVAARRKIQQSFPTAGEAAVYKKCPNCGAVYTRPTGCNYIGVCGAGGSVKDAAHNGTMKLQLQYDYNRNMRVLNIREGEAGLLEKSAWLMRRAFRDMAAHLPIHSTHYVDPAESGWGFQSTGVFKKYGCGVGGLRWDTMVALSKQELVELGLVPSGGESDATAEPCLDSKTMPMSSFLDMCGEVFKVYEPTFKRNGFKKVKALVDIPEGERRDTLTWFGVKSMHQMVILSKLKAFR